ncbi:hypothetical protein HER10_EVM0004176 [Colletotrichum scovillei]|uniref:uncharacterized protein n=1 Tax=Colletotrichum scovillei TaxID=1209932 RepID=UPI0015C3D00E|nr:uncharacterized protein HER10_EVM0004176 [Colletotrichum scovillei]KAF4784100.1 hypothetical protein HER10_EVM0004176 [Colletotrichum scovillei]
MDAPRAFGLPPQATFHDIPYDQRWEPLKNIIISAFLGDATSSSLTFPKLCEFMKEHHGFDASPAQYRYRLGQWGIRKNTKKDEKTAVITVIGKRNRPGGKVADVEIRQGEMMRPVDSKQIKRFINDSIRHHSVPALTPGMISQWNLPYAAYRASFARRDDQAFPFSQNPPTPQYLRVNSPDTSTNTVDYYCTIPSPPKEQTSFDLGDQSSWTEWPSSQTSRSYQTSIQEAFTASRFSAISPDEVPINNEVVAKVLTKSPEQLSLDSWVFAIMTGNIDLLKKLVSEGVPIPDLDFAGIHPYHLAASFVDGGSVCCLVFCELTRSLSRRYPIALKNIDSNGHTVLDTLMISILRSHTDCLPADVSTSFVHCTRFPGEEKDICGRWDADSPAVRHLHSSGQSRVPARWKHTFCHTDFSDGVAPVAGSR